jgi:hypothetical protein
MSFKYQSIPLDGDSEEKVHSDTSSITLEGQDDYRDDQIAILAQPTTRDKLRSKWLWIIHGILLFLSFSMFVLSHINFTSTLEHVRLYSAWSPADASVKYGQVKYNLTTEGNRFVGQGPEVDKAWREISYDMGDQWISKSDLAKLGMPEWHLRVDNPKSGEEGYRVGMEVFHHLHCLNLLRRVTYKEYYTLQGGEFAHGPKELQVHTGMHRLRRPHQNC